METNEIHKQYINSEISQYQLADLLGLDYTRIGAYIMANGLRQIDKDTLYGITCPDCGQKWLIPYQERHVCGKCQTVITIDWSGANEVI